MGRLNSMKGGGFLNNVDATIRDYEIRDTFPGGSAADPSDPQIFIVLKVQQDGDAATKETTLRAGSGKFLTIKDSHTLVNPEGTMARIWDKSDAYNFLQSAEAAGLADGGIDDTTPDVLSFGGLINARVRLVQKADTGRMEARQKAGQNPKRVDEATGKEYDFTRLEVEKFYGYDSMATKPVGAGKTAAAAKSGNGVAPKAGAVDLTGEAVDVLTRILGANGGSIQRSQIAMLVTKAEQANPNREALRKLIWSEDFLANAPGIKFDRAGKTQEVSLA